MAKHHNRPGGPTNPPQHSAGEAAGRPPPPASKHRQTGPGTARELASGYHPEVEDPHPQNEEHYDRERRPGGANPPEKDLSTSVHRHDGTAPPPPRNATNTRP